MIALLCQHYKMAGLVSQTQGLRSPSAYQLQLPLDQFDEDFDLLTGTLINPRSLGSSHTIMTGIRCRFQISQVWQEIGILFSEIKKPLIHEQVMELDTKLIQIEQSWPSYARTRFEPRTTEFIPGFTPLPYQSETEGSDQHPILLIDRLGCFAVLAAAMIRLHRGFLVANDGVPPEDVALHRQRTMHYGRG